MKMARHGALLMSVEGYSGKTVAIGVQSEDDLFASAFLVGDESSLLVLGVPTPFAYQSDIVGWRRTNSYLYWGRHPPSPSVRQYDQDWNARLSFLYPYWIGAAIITLVGCGTVKCLAGRLGMKALRRFLVSGGVSLLVLLLLAAISDVGIKLCPVVWPNNLRSSVFPCRPAEDRCANILADRTIVSGPRKS
jgi:hypothetical protein